MATRLIERLGGGENKLVDVVDPEPLLEKLIKGGMTCMLRALVRRFLVGEFVKVDLLGTLDRITCVVSVSLTEESAADEVLSRVRQLQEEGFLRLSPGLACIMACLIDTPEKAAKIVKIFTKQELSAANAEDRWVVRGHSE